MTGMKAVYYVATALVGVVMFWAGFAVRPLIDAQKQQETVVQQETTVQQGEVLAQGEAMDIQQAELSAKELAAQGYISAEALDVRIDDGEVQWFDGVAWHGVASVEEMAKEDKFYAAQEVFREFEEQLKQQKEADRAAEESAAGQSGTLSIGQKEEPRPTAKPQSTKPQSTSPTVTAPSPVVPPVLEPQPMPVPDNSVTAPDSGNSGSGGGNSGSGDGGNSGSGSGDGGNSDPGSGDGGDSGSGGDTGSGDSGGSDTGDGENMEWSEDYL